MRGNIGAQARRWLDIGRKLTGAHDEVELILFQLPVGATVHNEILHQHFQLFHFPHDKNEGFRMVQIALLK